MVIRFCVILSDCPTDSNVHTAPCFREIQSAVTTRWQDTVTIIVVVAVRPLFYTCTYTCIRTSMHTQRGRQLSFVFRFYWLMLRTRPGAESADFPHLFTPRLFGSIFCRRRPLSSSSSLSSSPPPPSSSYKEELGEQKTKRNKKRFWTTSKAMNRYSVLCTGDDLANGRRQICIVKRKVESC